MKRLTQEERVEKSRQALLDAGAELVAVQGYHGVTSAQIAERAGYSREMVRVRFGSKLELMRTLLLEDYQDIMMARELPDVSGLEQLLHLGQQMQVLADQAPVRLKAAFVLSLEAAISVPALLPDVEPWLHHLRRQAEQIINKGIADGSIRPCNAENLAEALLRGSIGTAYEYLRGGQGSLPDSMAGLLQEFIAV